MILKNGEKLRVDEHSVQRIKTVNGRKVRKMKGSGHMKRLQDYHFVKGKVTERTDAEELRAGPCAPGVAISRPLCRHFPPLCRHFPPRVGVSRPVSPFPRPVSPFLAP